MRILVTNDDGIYSPGLRVLAELVGDFGDVRVVAPDVEQSSMAHAITASRPLHHRPAPLALGAHELDAWRVDGTPADCVALGAHLWRPIDLVCSGINLGTNLGSQMWHSGTLAAAKHATLLGYRAAAFSAPPLDDAGYRRIAPFIREVLRTLLAYPRLRLVNVNLPERPRGLVWTRQSVRQYDSEVVPGRDPLGRELYWYMAAPMEPPDEETDRWAFEHDLVSITPLRLDLTDEAALAERRCTNVAHP